jgi:hypothetical protein
MGPGPRANSDSVSLDLNEAAHLDLRGSRRHRARLHGSLLIIRENLEVSRFLFVRFTPGGTRSVRTTNVPTR